MWQELPGKTKRFAGTSGTVTVPKGCCILRATCHSSGAATVTLPDGNGGDVTIPVASTGFSYEPEHLLCQVAADYSIVFTGTDGYFVEIYSSRGLF